MEKKFQSQKVMLGNGWYDELIKAVDLNSNAISDSSDENAKAILERNKRIQEKLDKYKKS